MRVEAPRHVAVIMDGNGRWAQARGLARSEGHRAGSRSIRAVVTRCRELGVRYLTLYAFSVENWGRSAREVGALMTLLQRFLFREREHLLRHRIELVAIGDTERLPRFARRALDEVICATRGSEGMRLTLALSYGGRDEITRAVRRLAAEVTAGELDSSAINGNDLARHLDTGDTPDPDLVIRTGGEQRLSNFLLWQAAYAELYFTEVSWPDFTGERLDEAIAWYGRRHRRFGLVEDCQGSGSAAVGKAAYQANQNA